MPSWSFFYCGCCSDRRWLLRSQSCYSLECRASSVVNKFFDSSLNFFKNLFFIPAITSFQKNTKGKVKPFSAQILFLLSLLSWLVWLIVQDRDAKQFVSLYGWFFLIVGSYWFFTDNLEKKKLVIPGLKFRINYGPWVTAALIVLAFWSNEFLIPTATVALVVWPIVSVSIAAFQKLLIRQSDEVVVTLPKDAAVRQDLVIVVLIGLLVSCWFQFYFLLQDILEEYPTLLDDNFGNSAFVSPIGTRTATARGVTILETAEARIRRELAGRSWLQVQQWLRNIKAEVPRLEREIIDQAYADNPGLEESDLWRFNAEFSDALPDDILQLQAIWIGPSSRPGGYYLEKTCLIRPVSSQSSLTERYQGIPYDMDCQPITSTLNRQPESQPENPSENQPEIFE